MGGMEAIEKHCHTLTLYVYDEMLHTTHHNGQPLFELYGNHSSRDSSKQV